LEIFFNCWIPVSSLHWHCIIQSLPVSEWVAMLPVLGLFSEKGYSNAKVFRRKVIWIFATKHTCEQKVLKEVKRIKVKGIHDGCSLITNMFTSNTGKVVVAQAGGFCYVG
jgi:hypothetical protein